MKNLTIWILSLLVLLFAIVGIIYLPSKSIEPYSSMFSAAGSFIAVIWFYNGLKLQSKQLEKQEEQIKKQSEQFQLEFNKLKLESKRNAILVAKDILNDMEPRVTSKLGGEIETLPSLFLNFLQYLKPITQSDDPEVVLNAVELMSKVLIPARIFLYAIREAGMCILENEGLTFKDPKAISGMPEYYIVANYDKLLYTPFISRHINTAKILADLMSYIDLEVVTHATFAALELKNQQSNIKTMITDEAIESMRKYNNKKIKPVPIIEKYLQSIGK